MKQMARAVTQAVAGVQQLRNEVEVIPTAALVAWGAERPSVVFEFSRNREVVHEW
jgi:hypothetical protein